MLLTVCESVVIKPVFLVITESFENMAQGPNG